MKSNKNNAHDAEVICQVASRPLRRFVNAPAVSKTTRHICMRHSFWDLLELMLLEAFFLHDEVFQDECIHLALAEGVEGVCRSVHDGFAF